MPEPPTSDRPRPGDVSDEDPSTTTDDSAGRTDDSPGHTDGGSTDDHEDDDTARASATPATAFDARDVLERVDDAFFAVDDEWRFTYVNARAAAMLERPADDLVGENVWAQFPEAVNDLFYEEYHRAMADQEQVTFEEYFEPLDTWFEVRAYPDEDGLSVYFTDVSERKHREQVNASLLETAETLLAADSPEEVAERVVESAREVLGFRINSVRLYDPETGELTPVAVSDVTRDYLEDVPGDAPSDAPLRRAFEAGETRVFEDMADPSASEYEPLQAAMAIPLGTHGTLNVAREDDAGFDDTDVDLAELLATLAETALTRTKRRQKLRRYGEALESIDGMVYALDEDGRFTLVTRPFADRLGHDRADLLGEPARVAATEETLATGEEHIERCLETGEDTATYEGRLVTAGGERVPVEVSLTVLRDDDGTFGGSVGVARDIAERTERRQYHRVLNRLLRHNLRNDLNAVMGYADLLAAALDDPDHAAEAAQLRDIAADLEDLLEKAHAIERVVGDQTVERRPVDVAAMVRESVATHREAHPGATIETHVPEELQARGDPRLRTALDNLVQNAIEHNDHDAPTVRVSAREVGEQVEVSVADDGPGIPDHERAVVSGERDITQLIHGSGLGLWLVKWLVDSCGGSLDFETSSAGTVVRLVLPVARD